MKRKELYEFVREGIISELSETTYAGVGAVDKIQKDPKFGKLKPDAKTNALNDLKTGGDVELEEMARIPNKIRVGDAAKVALAKELYGPETMEGRLIAAIEGSEDGLTQKELGAALGVTIDSKLNPLIQKLAFAQVVTKPAKTPTPEPEATIEPEVTAEPEEELPTLDPEEEPVDDYEKPEEDDDYNEEEEVEKQAKKATKKDELVVALEGQKNKIDKDLEDLKSEMKQIANEYKAASEANKPEIFQVLKSKTAAKKELEAKKAQIEKQLKAQIEKQLNIGI